MIAKQVLAAGLLGGAAILGLRMAGGLGGEAEPPAASTEAPPAPAAQEGAPATQAATAAAPTSAASPPPDAAASPPPDAAEAPPPDALARADAERLRLEAALAEAEAEARRLTAALAERESAPDLGAALEARDERLARLEAELAAQGEEMARLADALAAREVELARILDAAKMLGDAPAPLAAAFDEAAPPAEPQATTPLARGAELDRALAEAKERPLPRPAPTPAGQPLAQVHFDVGSARLTPGGEMRARAAAEMLAALDLGAIRVAGHSDTTGDPAFNLRLSRKRAEAVADFLVSIGVPRARIEVMALGEDASALPVPTAAGVAEPLNRCVGIYPVAA